MQVLVGDWSISWQKNFYYSPEYFVEFCYSWAEHIIGPMHLAQHTALTNSHKRYFEIGHCTRYKWMQPLVACMLASYAAWVRG